MNRPEWLADGPPRELVEMMTARLEVLLPSHAEGRRMTAAALRKGIRLQPVIEAAADVADYADAAIAIVREEHPAPLACKEGCWYCCCHPGILVSIPELIRIVDRVKRTLTPEQLDALRARAKDYTANVGGRSFAELSGSTPITCPLLVDERCSVYEVRPLTCRGYNSADANACRKEYEDASSTIPLMVVHKDAPDAALVGAIQALAGTRVNDALVDLGQALDIALSYEGDLEDFITRRDLLRRVENRKWAAELWKVVRQWSRGLGIRG